MVDSVDCKQFLSGQSRRFPHSSETGARRNRREETEGEAGRKGTALFFPPLPKSPSARSLQFFSCSAISRDLSTIKKGTACSL